MKNTYLKQLTNNAKRAAVWGRILPATQIVKPYTGVTRHVGTAY